MEAEEREKLFESLGAGSALLDVLDPLEGQCDIATLYNLIGIARSIVRTSSANAGCDWPLSAQLVLWTQTEVHKRQGVNPIVFLQHLATQGFDVIDTDRFTETRVHKISELLKFYFYIDKIISSKKLLRRIIEIAAIDRLNESGKTFPSLWKRLIDEFPHSAIIERVDTLKVSDFLKFDTLRNMVIASAFNPRGHLRVVK